MNKNYLLFLLICIPFLTQAQIQKSFHQVYEIGDSVEIIELSLHGEYEYKSWPGNNIMLQTKITLYDATPSILKFFMENGRYEVEATESGKELLLLALDKERRVIKSSGVECFEEVKQVIFLPEEFTDAGEGKFFKGGAAVENEDND